MASCEGYRCDVNANTCLTSCVNAMGNCAMGYCCAEPTCVPQKPNGAACTSSGECLSNDCHCVSKNNCNCQ
jgi:hypothetical protein